MPKLIRTSSTLSKNLSPILKVNPHTFAELMLDDGDNYVFDLTFSLYTTSIQKNIYNYDKVIVTVSKKESNNKNKVKDSGSNQSSSLTGKLKNNNDLLSDDKVLNLKNRSIVSKLPPYVSEKAYSGLSLLKDIEKKEDFIDQKVVLISNEIQSSIDKLYHVTELFEPEYKPDRQSWKRLENLQDRKFNTTNVLSKINLELCEITEVTSNEIFKNFTSETNFGDIDSATKIIKSSNNKMYQFDATRYFLDIVPKSQEENSTTWYETRDSTKKLEKVDILVKDVKIPKSNKNLILDVRFDLFKVESTIPDESTIANIYLESHVSAYRQIHNPPRASIVVNPTSKHDKEFEYVLTIQDEEEPGLISKFNIYMKQVNQKGSVSDYYLIGSVNNESTPLPFKFSSSTPLSIIRIIPVDYTGQESNIFTNVIAGNGWDFVGQLTIVPFHFDNEFISIQIYNIPENTISLTLYRRECIESFDTEFQQVSNLVGGITGNSATITDRSGRLPNKTYEYYVSCKIINDHSGQESLCDSNTVIYKTPDSIPTIRSRIIIDSQKVNQLNNGYLEVEFEIKSDVDKTEEENFTKLLSNDSRLKEVYDLFLNAQNNSSSALGNQNKGSFRYADMFVHEVVRTDLNTSEREIFPLVSNGIFLDNTDVQKKNKIKPVHPYHNYVYQVYTFVKDPIEIFKNYVAVISPSDGSPTWFYLPYKWKTSSFSDGTLYSDFEKTGVPYVPQYSAMTASSYGLTSTFELDKSTQHTNVDRVIAQRIDRNTVRISWNFMGMSVVNKTNLYDSFVVMKVVNGIRSFVGRSHKNFIYHELTEKDLGSIYYIIVPIVAEYDIENPVYSNSIIIDNDRIKPPIKISNSQKLSFV